MVGLEQAQVRQTQDADGVLQAGKKNWPPSGPLSLLAVLDKLTPFQRLIAVWNAGCATLGLVTLIGFQLDLNFTTAAFALLIIVVILSLLGSFVSSALFSVLAIACLNFFFVNPLFTLTVGEIDDLVALAAFLVTSLAVTSLIRRVRALGEERREQASLLDLTERKHTEALLRNSQSAYLAAAQKLSRIGCFGWNVTTGEVFWSEETYRILELDPGTVPSMAAALRQVHPEDQPRVMEALGLAQRNSEDLAYEHRLLLPDGRVKHVEVAGRAESAGGLHFIGALSDVTAGKEAFAALELSERRYRDVYDHMPIGLLQVDVKPVEAVFKALRAQGVTDLGPHFDRHPDLIAQITDSASIVAANGHALRIFGATTEQEMAGPSTRFWVPGVDTVRRNFEKRYRGDDFFQEETRMMTLDGRVIDILLTISRPATTPGRSLIGVIDITDRVRTQEMLTRLQADFAHAARLSVLGELTASIAHEVNQPLAAISANAQAGRRWLGRPDVDMAELRDIAGSIVADADRAAAIIARIRSMAAPQAPEQVLVPLDEVIREALVFLAPEIRSREVVISHQNGDGLPLVRGDRVQLQQVVVNLVINALQAMNETGTDRRRIAIRTSRVDAAAVLCTVDDSGPGIPSDHRARLFESFFTTKEGGMGMGLPICRSIIEAHGGRITAAENREEGGARICFTLPAAAA